VNYATGVSPAALVAADFRGDGRVDLAIVDENDGTGNPGSVSVLLGNGNGTFQTHVDYAVGNLPVGIVAADFNGDGKIVLAVVNKKTAPFPSFSETAMAHFNRKHLYQWAWNPRRLAAATLTMTGKVSRILCESRGGFGAPR
jgi:hypothetical protein